MKDLLRDCLRACYLAGRSNGLGRIDEDFNDFLETTIAKKLFSELNKNNNEIDNVSFRDLYGELRMLGLSSEYCDKVLEWTKTL